MNRQSKPILKSSKNHRNNRSRGFGLDGFSRIVIIALLLFLCVSFWANMKMINLESADSNDTATTTNNNNQQKQQLRSQPLTGRNFQPLIFPSYPKSSTKTTTTTNAAINSNTNNNIENPNTILIEEWNLWAAQPMVGSYKFDDEGTAILHNPYMDLQSYYRNIKIPRFGGNNALNNMFHQHDGGHVIGGNSASSSLSTSTSPAKLTTTTTTNGGGLHLAKTQFPDEDGAVLTRKGNKFMASGVKYNQDRVLMLSWPEIDDWWMGLFDGHGFHGHITSQYASFEFAKQLQQQQQQQQSASSAEPVSVINDIFHNIQQSLPQVPDSGTTGISIWKRQNQLYISNIGDSTAFVASYTDTDNNNVGNIEIVYETVPHKPNMPEERKRIESMGGTVIDPQFPGESARILIPNEHNPAFSMALAMSRSIGDVEGAPYGLSPIPTTKVFDLNTLDATKHHIVVAASDGLFDKISPIEIAKTFAQSFSSSSGKSSSRNGDLFTPLEAAEKLIMDSSHIWNFQVFGDGDGYRDDISVAVHRLKL